MTGAGIELHPEERDPLVRIRITAPMIGGAAGWLEVKPFIVLWCAAGAAWVDVDGAPFPVDRLEQVDDYRDLLGARLVIVDQALADDALEVLRPRARR